MSESLTAHLVETIIGIDLKDSAVRDTLLNVMRSLAEDEDRVEVICVGMPESIAFHVRCGPSDVGRVIGDGGRTARAVRGLLKAIASKNGRKYSLFIAE